MKIAILDDHQDAVRKLDCFRLLDGHDVQVLHDTIKDLDTLAARIAEAEVLVLIRERTPVPRALLEQLPNLRFIAQTGKASAHIDLDAATEFGIPVTESRFSGVATAELVWGLILAAARRIPQYAANLKAGVWQRSGLEDDATPYGHGLGVALEHRTLGIWGYGRIGRRLAQYATAFGMRVLVWSRPESLALAAEHGHELAADAHDLFTRSDVLTLQVRQNDATRGMVTLDHLLAMKPDALFVNTSRAGLVQPGALAEALARGRPGLAALDVFDEEPALRDAFVQMPNVVCTPHLGYVQKENYETLFDAAFRDVLAWQAGTPRNLVNPAAFGRRH
ncbi:D-2-hydroxyacid dehydrogenase family protein [Caballeronia sp. LZ033]|uniref:D-2-hydroxyacid dehydrogenase family protein n=1 Tax=Caballeronia sp. LZ033 TaxID=3038566 RepID=UPI002861C051|nr:D-2-hydroxyacid dehydrogenase family protein [Caballeronia sp. LZ033]MDR5815428.1 D-2-hydroxyacid dehydrogenase family protein [Caballeronia sp. LZ033]